jgi:DNA mismatch endonuclease (patch repair protein)
VDRHVDDHTKLSTHDVEGMHSSETRRKISTTLLGHGVTEETRRKISDSRRGTPAWNKGLKGSTRASSTSFKKGIVPWNKNVKGVMPTPWNKGRKESLSETARQKIVLAHKGKTPWNKGKHPYLERPETRKKIAAARLQQVFPSKDTTIERILQDELRSQNIPFTTHYPITGQPDIAFPQERVAVFCDGDYWHNLPNQRIKDEQHNRLLELAGWTVLRFWEHEIETDALSCVERVKETLL